MRKKRADERGTPRRRTAKRPAKRPADTGVVAKPKTASGKRLDNEVLKKAEQGAVAGTIERVRAGEHHAGRAPQSTPVDDAIRDRMPVPNTADSQLLNPPGPANDFTRTDPWRVLRI